MTAASGHASSVSRQRGEGKHATSRMARPVRLPFRGTKSDWIGIKRVSATSQEQLRCTFGGGGVHDECGNDRHA